MPLCMFLYKVDLNGEEVILTNYKDKDGLVVIKSGLMNVVRMVEAEWRTKKFEEVAIDAFYLNPSVIALGKDVNNAFLWGILKDPYMVTMLSVAGTNKLLMAKCEGPNAVKFWNKGRKPKLPENTNVSDNERQANIPNPILPSGETLGVSDQHQDSERTQEAGDGSGNLPQG